jgi:hypothetical protein
LEGSSRGPSELSKDGSNFFLLKTGMADYELGMPNTPSTRFCVASITKEMTRIVAIRLMEQRKLAMGDTLAETSCSSLRPKIPSIALRTMERSGW